MTHLEIKELFGKKLSEAKALIESAKNSEGLTVKQTLSYCDDNLDESQEYNEKGETSLIGDLEIRIAGRDGEDDPIVSLGLLCDLKGSNVKKPEELDDEFANFEKELNEFIKGLSSAESTEEFITAESDRIDAENEQKVKELEEKLDKLTKYTKICAFSLIAIVFIILLIKTLLQ